MQSALTQQETWYGEGISLEIYCQDGVCLAEIVLTRPPRWAKSIELYLTYQPRDPAGFPCRPREKKVLATISLPTSSTTDSENVRLHCWFDEPRQPLRILHSQISWRSTTVAGCQD